MAEKQTVVEENAASNKNFEFPFEWVSKHCDGAGVPFNMSKELASTFAQLKVMNESADSDGTSVLESLLNTQKNLELSVANYKSMMDCLPINLTDLPPDTKNDYEEIVQNRLDVGSGDEVLDEIISTNYQKELARMEMVSQSLDGILGQIDAMKQQFVADFGESSVGEEESGEMKPSECAEFLEDKVAASKQELNEEEVEKFFGAFKDYKEVKEYLEKIEKVKKVESKLDAALAKYKDLPPDLLLAKEVLKKQEKEMKDLSAEIEFLKNNMDSSVLEMFNP